METLSYFLRTFISFVFNFFIFLFAFWKSIFGGITPESKHIKVFAMDTKEDAPSVWPKLLFTLPTYKLSFRSLHSTSPIEFSSTSSKY